MIKDEIIAALAKLPQARHFRQEDMQRFAAMHANSPKWKWHVERLSGIGGSEIGVAVAEIRGEDDAFGSSVNRIIREKLLRNLPPPATLAMRKGAIVEQGIRQIFIEDTGAVQDSASLKLFNSNEYKKPLKWMRYSPDDIVFIDGKRYLVDYKHPNNAHGHHEIPLRYHAQLHQGMMLLEHNGIQVEGMLLVQYPQRGDDLIISKLERDEDLMSDIVRSGNGVWDHVMSGQIPALTESNGISWMSEKDAIAIRGLSRDYVNAKIMSDIIAESAEQIRSKIIEIVGQNLTNIEGKIKTEDLLISTKRQFDLRTALSLAGDLAKKAATPEYSAELMEEYLKAQGVDMSRFETGKTKYDEDVLKNVLKDIGQEDKCMAVKARFLVRCDEQYTESVADHALDALKKLHGPAKNRPSA